MSSPATMSSKARAQARKRRAVELAVAGATYDQIAEELGYKSRSSAYSAVQQALREIAPQDAAELENLRAQELQRLDALQRAHWVQALRGDHRSTEVVLKISDRRSKLLGLDAPQEAHVVVTTQLDEEIEGLLALMPRPEKG